MSVLLWWAPRPPPCGGGRGAGSGRPAHVVEAHQEDRPAGAELQDRHPLGGFHAARAEEHLGGFVRNPPVVADLRRQGQGGGAVGEQGDRDVIQIGAGQYEVSIHVVTSPSPGGYGPPPRPAGRGGGW